MKFKQNLMKLITLLLFALSPLSALAQGGQNMVKVKVDLVSLGEAAHGLYLKGKKGKTVTAKPFTYGQTIKYTGERIIEIHQGSSTSGQDVAMSEEDKEHALQPLTLKDLPAVKADGTDKYQQVIENMREESPSLVALASVPPNATHITILLTADINNTFRTLVFNDDPSKLPYGRLSIHNFCKHPIGLKFKSSKPAVLKPDTDLVVRPSARQSVSYMLSYPKNGKWKVQESNLVRVKPDHQVRMIVLNSSSTFFKSGSGTRGGRLQIAVLRRDRSLKKPDAVN